MTISWVALLKIRQQLGMNFKHDTLDSYHVMSKLGDQTAHVLCIPSSLAFQRFPHNCTMLIIENQSTQIYASFGSTQRISISYGKIHML
jgi:hypothetical protein